MMPSPRSGAPRPARRLLPVFIVALFLAVPARGEDLFTQEKCSLCHIRQSVFFTPDFADPARLAEDYGEERLCGSCHNGSVRDSRADLWRGAQHPIPGGGGAGGKEKRCSRCHTPHEKGGWGVLAGRGVSLRKGGDAVCSGCHAGRDSSGGSLHRKGFPQGGCGECHRAHGGVGKTLLREARETLCLRCHKGQDAAKTGGHRVNTAAAPAGSGKPLPDCASCHPVHGPADAPSPIDARCASCHPAVAGGGPAGRTLHPDTAACTTCHTFHARTGQGGTGFRGRDMRPDLMCAACHDRYASSSPEAARGKGTHPTARKGAPDLCLRCHKLHGPAPGTRLLATDKSYACLDCHAGQNTISETAGISLSHPVFERVPRGRLDAVRRNRGIVLGPSGEIVCRTCHGIHGADPGSILLHAGSAKNAACLWCHEEMDGKNHLPGNRKKGGDGAEPPGCSSCHPVHGRRDLGKDPWKAVCTGCHDERSTHRPAKLSPGVPAGALPGFDERGRARQGGTISCPTCHEPHGAPARANRLRKIYEPSGFACTACHPEMETIAMTPHDLRGTAAKSVCEPCHVPHGGTPPWMWGVPATDGEKGEEACRSCHREGGASRNVPKAGHPVNIVAPRPFPGNFPLFGPDGSKINKGVLTCPTCHDPHGTSYVFAGQGWEKLLRSAEKTPAGEAFVRDAACRPCHAEKRSEHGEADCVFCHAPHKAATSPGECGACHDDRRGGTAQAHLDKKVGCNQCHRIHPSAGGVAEKVPGPAGACLSCHPRNERIVGTPHGDLMGGPCGTCHPAHDNLAVSPLPRRKYEEIFAPDIPCLRCHNEEGNGPIPEHIAHPKSKRQVPTTYGAVVVIENPITMVGRQQEKGRPMFPLFGSGGLPGSSGELGCLTCHDPHAGKTATLSGREEPLKYLRDPTGGFLSDICSGCHKGEAGEHIRKFHVHPRKES